MEFISFIEILSQSKAVNKDSRIIWGFVCDCRVHYKPIKGRPMCKATITA